MKRIKPSHLSRQSEGFCWGEYKVTLPESVALHDLNEDTALFAGLQLREDDGLRIIAHDRSWCASCIIIEAAPERVVLSKPQMLWSNQSGRIGVAFEDANYLVRWAGSSYELLRKGVGDRQPQLIRSGFTSIAQAKIELSRQYPKVA